MSTEKTAWGYQSDTDESLKTKAGGRFGLNNAFITKFEFNPNAGKDESLADAIDITVAIGDKEFRSRVYDITGDLFKGNEQVSPGEEGYDALYNTEKKQREAVIIHTAKALGATEDQIIQALKTGNVVDFASWAKAMCSIKPADFATRPVDVFLEYQWNIKEGNTRTFLQLPSNMKGGRFLCPSVTPVGSWKDVVDAKGLRYVDDAGNEHPFTRSENFMGSNKAKLQTEDGEEEDSATIEGTSAVKSKW